MDPKEALQVLLDDGYKPDMAEAVIAQLQAEGKLEPYDPNAASAPRPPAAIYTGPTADVDTPGSQGYTDLSNFIPTGRRSQEPSSDVIGQANAIAKSMFGKDYGFTAFAGQEPPSAMLAGSRLNHPNGVAADGYLTYKGEPVKDQAKAESFLQGWLGANPGGSVGIGKGYMDRPGYPNATNVHIQTNRGLQWGRGGRTANLDPSLTAPFNQARASGQLPFNVFENQTFLPDFRPDTPIDMIIGNAQPSAGTPTSRGRTAVGVSETGRPDMATGVPTSRPDQPQDANWNAPIADQTSQIMADLQRDFDFTPEQAAGIVGNLAHETMNFERMQEISPRAGEGGWGWAQWTGDRRDNFEEWADERGLARDSYEANYGFLKHELETTEKRTVDKVKAADTPEKAAVAFEKAFERAGVKSYDERERYAREAFDVFQATTDMDPAANYARYGQMQGTAPTQPTFRGTPTPDALINPGNATTRGMAPPDINVLTPQIAAGNANTRGMAPPAQPSPGNATTRGLMPTPLSGRTPLDAPPVAQNTAPITQMLEAILAPANPAPVGAVTRGADLAPPAAPTGVTRGPDLPPATANPANRGMQGLLDQALNYAPEPEQIPIQLDSGLRTSPGLLERGEVPASIMQSWPMSQRAPAENTAPARSVPTSSFSLPTEDATAQQLTDRLGELNASPVGAGSVGDRAEQLSDLFSAANAARAAESNAAIDAAAQRAAQQRMAGNATTRGAAPPPDINVLTPQIAAGNATTRGVAPPISQGMATGTPTFRPDTLAGGANVTTPSYRASTVPTTTPSFRPFSFTGGAEPATPSFRADTVATTTPTFRENSFTGGADPATPTFRPATQAASQSAAMGSPAMPSFGAAATGGSAGAMLENFFGGVLGGAGSASTNTSTEDGDRQESMFSSAKEEETYADPNPNAGGVSFSSQNSTASGGDEGYYNPGAGFGGTASYGGSSSSGSSPAAGGGSSGGYGFADFLSDLFGGSTDPEDYSFSGY